MQFIFNSFVAIAFLVANAGALPRPAAEPVPPFSIVNVDGGQTAAAAVPVGTPAGAPAGAPAGGPLTVTVTQPAQKIIQTVTVTVTKNNDVPAATTDNAAVVTTDGMVLTKPANAPAGATLSVVDNASTTEIIGLSSDRAKATPVHHSNGVVTLTEQPTPTTTIHDNGQWHTFYPTERTTMTMKTEPTTVAW